MKSIRTVVTYITIKSPETSDNNVRIRICIIRAYIFHHQSTPPTWIIYLSSELNKNTGFFKYVGRLGNQQTDPIRLKTMDMIVLAINKLSLSREKKEKNF